MIKSIAVVVLVAAAPIVMAQSFGIGPRISNYSTDITSVTTTETGRQVAFGLAGDYRSGAFVLDYLWEHDPENGIDLTDILVDTGNYSRNRGEVTVGYSIGNFLDLQGGLRLDSIRVGGTSFFGSPIATDLEMEHQALTAGLRIHSDEQQPVAFYALARGYLGDAKLDFATLVDADDETSGFRIEAGIPIRLGESNWRIVPGAEVERLETNDFAIEIKTNRVFLNFLYRR